MSKSNNAKKRPAADQPLIGAHESIAGGIHTAFERAESIGCRALQVFTKNASQWLGKPLSEEDIANYKRAASESTIRHVVAHSSYLINLCSADPDIQKKSRASFLDEIRRCESLGIPYYNFHPGAHMQRGEEEGIRCLVGALDSIHDETKDFRTLSVLETTAGQGSVIGYRFEQLREIIDRVKHPGRMAVCIDTCHIFAAGYDISTEEGYESTMKAFDDIIGIDRLVAIHVNDSKKELGTKRDRHEHIGKGFIGKTGFRCIMKDERLRGIPKILETPKDEDLKEDRMNLAMLRKLARS